MKLRILYAALFFLIASSNAYAFCGFYVAKADASLYNKASQVVLVRHEDKTVISMMNDFEGDLTQFALVVPVPEILKEGQINVGDRKLFSRIDAFTAPRLVEYFDPNPCMRYELMKNMARVPKADSGGVGKSREARHRGVTVEAEYTIGEYDIVILSAKESEGLENWLIDNEYNIPVGAKEALAPYIKQDMKFFVAKVNLKEQTKTGLSYLRPLQFAFNSKRFMLPIRLGMINAKGPQELLVYVITKNGRVETTNYQTVKLPTGMDIPLYVKDEFADFYKSMFSEQVKRQGMKTVFTEYFWNMGWCDPCASDPLSPEELRKLGVFWIDKDAPSRPGILPGQPRRMIMPPRGVQAMVTRLHLRYTNETFPEDLMFQETKDSTNFQGRYVLRHPWKGDAGECAQARTYLRDLPKRQDKEAQELARLTGWDVNDIRKKMNLKTGPDGGTSVGGGGTWWNDLWK